ncbi:putative O-glycosylation ligase, exosortase A system-associated [Altererythrobacter salegens]|uniref:Putative O-glycosylation ligase, exosortase A system-associated n=1 Tax=Croceibacterium salegens TaxID=1737568 RepID=A0A6I4SXK9_9SPHN|nr:putative O-glycosylation ligase, exosortase A system-associated [Croceibacterium salegens]MXO60755.1 putative O-glycosylation ligase, exosortase A system-associated [Croceibacterium salegens]
MLDFFLLAFVGVFLALGFKRPFFWVLVYIYIDVVAPQKVGWTIIQSIPLSLIAFAACFGGWLFLDSKKGSRFTLRQGLIVALLVYCYITTQAADFPVEAQVKWDWVWKALVFAAFLPLTLRTKLRLEAAALIMVLSLGTIVINGGIKTVFGGGGYGTLALLVREDAGLYEGSILSTAAVATVPLALWLARHGTIFKPDWRVWAFVAGLILSCLLIPVGTAARTGLVCAAVLGVLMLRTAKHKFLLAGGGALMLVAALPFLPQSYLERMQTLSNTQGDESASTRVQVWQWTLDYVEKNPWGGGFDAYRQNSFTYWTAKREGTPPNVRVVYDQVTDQGRAYHSSYFEMLGEQGWLGLGLWLWLQLLGVWHMERIRWMFRRGEDGKDCWQRGMATALQQAQIVYLIGSLFVGIAFQPFIYMLVGLQCGLWSYVRRTTRQPDKARFQRPGETEPGPA